LVPQNTRLPDKLLYDKYTAHTSACFKSNCGQENLVLVCFPAHTTDQCQPLDLISFGALKQHASTKQSVETVSKQTDQILKILNGFFSGTVPHKIVAAFQRADITPFFHGEKIYGKIDRSLATQVRHRNRNPERLPAFHGFANTRISLNN
jgi:hypothetical protein